MTSLIKTLFATLAVAIRIIPINAMNAKKKNFALAAILLLLTHRTAKIVAMAINALTGAGLAFASAMTKR